VQSNLLAAKELQVSLNILIFTITITVDRHISKDGRIKQGGQPYESEYDNAWNWNRDG
jgi:hypothetical protein